MSSDLEKQIEKARERVAVKKTEVEQLGRPQRELAAAEQELKDLEAFLPAFEAAKKKRLAEFEKLEVLQEKNIMQTLKALDTAWDAALLEVVAVRDAEALDEDRDMPKYFTLFGNTHFGSIENILENIEIREGEIFNKAEIKNRIERYKIAEGKGINVSYYPRYR